MTSKTPDDAPSSAGKITLLNVEDRNILESIVLRPRNSNASDDKETKRLKREIRCLQKAARVLFWEEENGTKQKEEDPLDSSDEDGDQNNEENLKRALARTLASRKREAHLRSRRILLKKGLPFYVGHTLCIVGLGKINTQSENFHTRRHIYPVGFRSTRTYFSIWSPGERMIYRNEIIERDGKPIFRITSADAPDLLVEKETARAAWRDIVRKVAVIRNDATLKVHKSGANMFGYGEPEVMTLIEGMKGALMCRMYEFKENRNVLKSIDDVTSRDVIEKTNRIERHVRWKEYVALCLTKQSQVPKQLVSSQSYQNIIEEHVRGVARTNSATTTGTEFPDILSKRVSEERK